MSSLDNEGREFYPGTFAFRPRELTVVGSGDVFFFLFNCFLAVPRPTLGHSQGDSLTNPILITAYVRIRLEGHREPRNQVGSLSPAERLVGFKPGTFRFLFQRINPLGHSPRLLYTIV